MREVVVFAIALLVFAVVDLPLFAVLVLGWLIGWAATSYFRGLFERTAVRAIIVVAGVGFGARAFWLRGPELIEAEGLAGMRSVLADRFRAQATPAIAPPVIHGDRRQRFFVHAGGEPRLSISFGTAAEVAAADWGHGLFAVDYDPRTAGAPAAASGETTARMSNGGTLPMTAVIPRAKPRWICTDGARKAAVLSEETDQVFLIEGTAAPSVRPTCDQPVACAFAGTELAIACRGDGKTAVAALGDRLEFGLESALPEAPDHLLFAGGRLYAALRRAHAIVRLDDGATLELGRPAITLRKTADERFLLVPVSDHLAEGEPGENHEIRDQLLLIDTRTFRIAAAIPTPGTPIGVTATSSAAILVALAGEGRIASAAGTKFVTELPGAFDVAELEPDLVVATSPALGAIALFDRTGHRRAWHPLAADRDEGELAFYESTRSQISCASCHLHADTDLATHDIGHGRASPTLSVRGVAGTSPYLRGASYPTLDALDTFARTILGGYERELPDRARMLASYVTWLPPIGPPRRSPADPRAGVDSFVKAGCDDCHAFPAFTNLAQVPASYLFPELGKTDRLLDTPSLLNLARSAPYLDDGRAKTIESVLIEHNPSRRHGNAHLLDDRERRALLELLESL